MDLSSLNTAFNTLAKKIQDYLDNPVKFEYADFEKQRDIIFISNQYNQIVCDFSNLLNLITEIQYFVSQCKKIISWTEIAIVLVGAVLLYKLNPKKFKKEVKKIMK